MIGASGFLDLPLPAIATAIYDAIGAGTGCPTALLREVHDKHPNLKLSSLEQSQDIETHQTLGDALLRFWWATSFSLAAATHSVSAFA